MKKIDLTGMVFTRLTVDQEAKESLSGKPAWICRCDCGNMVLVRGSDLRMGKHRSCGCLLTDTVTKHGETHGGGIRTPEYSIWIAMKQRCYNPKHTRYADWGGRGIVVCERWKNSFQNFLADMGRKPSPAHSIDRIDNNKGYSPENCKWSSRMEQMHNKRPWGSNRKNK